MRGPTRQLTYRLGRLLGLTQARLDQVMARLRRGGTTAVTLELTTPGLANLSLRVYAPDLIAGSAFFLTWHFAIGYADGVAVNLIQLQAPTVIALGIGVLVFGKVAQPSPKWPFQGP